MEEGRRAAESQLGPQSRAPRTAKASRAPGRPHQRSRFPTDEPPCGGGRVRVRRPGARAGLTSPTRTPSSRVQK